MGILLPIKKKMNIYQFIFITLSILVGVETIQLLLKVGIFDIDDIIQN